MVKILNVAYSIIKFVKNLHFLYLVFVYFGSPEEELPQDFLRG